MNKQQRSRLVRLQKVLEVGSAREWADILRQVDASFTVSSVARLRRGIKQVLMEASSTNDAKRTRSKKRAKSESTRRTSEPSTRPKTLSELRAIRFAEDERPESSIFDGKEFTRWLQIIGRSPTVDRSLVNREAPNLLQHRRTRKG